MCLEGVGHVDLDSRGEILWVMVERHVITYMVWLVVSTPLKHMSSSVGMIIPNIWENNSHVPNQQPVVIQSFNVIHHL